MCIRTAAGTRPNKPSVWHDVAGLHSTDPYSLSTHGFALLLPTEPHSSPLQSCMLLDSLSNRTRPTLSPLHLRPAFTATTMFCATHLSPFHARPEPAHSPDASAVFFTSSISLETSTLTCSTAPFNATLSAAAFSAASARADWSAPLIESSNSDCLLSMSFFVEATSAMPSMVCKRRGTNNVGCVKGRRLVVGYVEWLKYRTGDAGNRHERLHCSDRTIENKPHSKDQRLS